MSISKAELESLMARQLDPGTCILSAYVNMDQSQAANLNLGYVRNLRERVRACEQKIQDEKQRQQFSHAAARIADFVAANGTRGRGLVAFADPAGQLFWQRELFIPIESTLRWEDKPYLRPLLEAFDEYERFAVVLVDREKARLFTVYLGEVEENRKVFSDEHRKNHKATSRDAIRSQPNLQRREDEHVHSHLKDVAAELEQLASSNSFDRLILGGPHKTTQELQSVLSKKLQSLVVRHITLPMDTSEQAVLAETMRVEEEVERAEEMEMVERLITTASKEDQGVLQLKPTLEAMRLGRIMTLVYAHGLSAEGAVCGKCGTLFAATNGNCEYCGGELQRVPDVIGRLADGVFYSGGRAENVRGPAAERLIEVGSIGALLRYKMASPA